MAMVWKINNTNLPSIQSLSLDWKVVMVKGNVILSGQDHHKGMNK
jgi:hypothetical protein